MSVDTQTTNRSLNAHAIDLREHAKRISRLEAVVAGIFIYELIKIVTAIVVALEGV